MNTFVALSALGFLSQVSAGGGDGAHPWEGRSVREEDDHRRRLSGDDEMTSCGVSLTVDGYVFMKKIFFSTFFSRLLHLFFFLFLKIIFDTLSSKTLTLPHDRLMLPQYCSFPSTTVPLQNWRPLRVPWRQFSCG